MSLAKEIKDFIHTNRNKKIAFFIDMDGTIANLEVDKNNDIAKNTPGFFLSKRPITTVLSLLAEVSTMPNVDFYILSACKYLSQVEEKRQWLKEYAPFFREDRQIFVVQEVTNYTEQNKATIKTENIKKVLQENSYDLAIYLEDEYQMLKQAYQSLGERVCCLHISNFIE